MLFQQEAFYNCPYCGEPISILIDESAGAQSYYEDCAVCCRPIFIVIQDDGAGVMHVALYRDDE
ncbi:MAG: CPXCG motif-containing cysteine-rich protein [Gammaproteobacteria bacterium]|nr:CPXCG motif-containing cysteine-rich protein [Gammaproteobacteria bacterium]